MRTIKDLKTESIIREKAIYGTLEEDFKINDISRAIIRRYKTQGEAWLGNINLYEETRGKPVIWQYTKGIIYNFGASFVVPCYDAQLEKLIIDRDKTPYTGTTQDRALLEKIYDRIEELKGTHLSWQ